MTAYERAANRLHHLSMRYAGAFAELTSGTPISFVPKDHPGLSEFRDLVDLILFVRAEVNAHTRLMVEAKLITVEQATKAVTEEYEFLTAAKAKQFGIEVNDAGLVYKNPNHPKE